MLSFSFLSTALLALGPLSAHAIPTPRNHRQQNEVQSQEIPAGCGGGDPSQSSASVATTAAVVSSSTVSSSIAVATPSASSVKSASAATSSSAVASSSVASTAVAAAASSTSNASLNSLAVAAGKKYFGSATDNSELTDTDYVAILSDSNMFGQITPGNSWKWDATEATQGVFTFTNADAIATLAEDNGQLLRGHNCVWYSQLPTWVSDGGFSAEELSDVMTTHCTTLLEHFKGQTYAFDIVNEPFNEDGTFRSDVFFDTLGSSYISTVLSAARTADPSTKLYINEYNIEYAGAKATAMASLVSNLTSASVPIDGVGMQAHFIVGSVPTDLKTQIQTFADLGVEVAITELDIRMTLPATDALLAQQKTDYENVVSACMGVDGCVGITIWDYTDKYSWVPSTFSGSGAACPWDENLATKPAFDGIVAALSA